MVLPSNLKSALAGCYAICVLSLVGWTMFVASSSDNVVCLDIGFTLGRRCVFIDKQVACEECPRWLKMTEVACEKTEVA